MACAQGALARLCMKEASGNPDFSSGATGFPFFRESLQKRKRIIHPDVITGTREEISERARFSPYVYGGWIVLSLTPGHAATLFPWILGADAVSTTYDLSDTLQSFGVLVDKVTGVHEFYNGYINRAIIHGKQNGPSGSPNWVTLAMQMLFMDYLAPGSSESYPSLSLAVTGEYAPFIFEDAVLTLTTAREVKEFTIDLNNHIQPRYVNDLEPTALCPSRRTITVSARVPYDSGTSNLYDLAVTGVSGTKTLAITNGTVSMTATFGALQVDTITPVVSGKQEIDMVLQMSARKASSTASLSWSIDSTP